ncbi:hypothetical protein [Tropicibacter naphthalenivorans]|uniref:Uncharacterized protein n=1 Tax=Tropicibacter naphthalenivorans TaxID=441103 RepID=A0A0P1G159_9RHOB|nr:hypothetical protein [Tropicibacter naphthalenivorans]CUH75247.1 hypothetical protein TRN7648_00342 [Tropicibacter naphthalenivorans]SMC45395.1 hypothetical protein SAMN04488093_101538 [Tropicibacter naphthalenivorans]
MIRTTLAALCLATPALAGEYCLIDGTERFSCTFNNGGKAVEVCDAIWDDDDIATYGFFIPGQDPELELRNEMTGMLYTKWNGMGEPFGSVSFNNADWSYTYEVWYAGEDGGINVLKQGEQIASLTCDTGSVTHDLDTLIERVETAQLSP